MKIPAFGVFIGRSFLCALLWTGLTPTWNAAAATLPSITSVQFDDKDVVVKVSIPDGVEKVTLESRPHLGSGTWVPRAVSRIDGKGSTVEFRLPRSAQIEILRVRADASDILPVSFYSGTNSFISGASASGPVASLGPVDSAVPGAGGAASNGSGTDSRTVVESDIWEINGSHLYFFNQYRGLQVIDLSAPDLPHITGTYPLPAAGEQMYILDDAHVLLLAQNNCDSSMGGNSQALVLDVSGENPREIASLPIPGWIQESRLVGTALYVASEAYQPVSGTDKSAWQWGSAISSFDLSAPDKPAVKDTLWYEGQGNVISATDQYLFVATQNPANWSQSIIRVIDISSSDGAMDGLASIPAAGLVPDKFKINQSGDVLSVISENWNGNGHGVVTALETFSLADPSAPVKLDRLQLAEGEQLHASRYDGDRVYVVTFLQKDPLWIVDLSDPKNLRIAGQVQVPGWSTYIQPLGNRLVTIGINDSNDWRVAVSLFNVEDPANASLLSKVPLGVNYSWSEASYDEKAFGVLPDAGLLLVPYQGYETNGYASRVQLIDLKSDSLAARGTIAHSFQPRRATLHNDRIYSISGKELLTVEASDRDHPAVRSDVELSWSVDQLFLVGNYVVEVANGNNWFGWWSQSSATPPSLRVTTTSDPDRTIGEFVLTNGLPVVGAALNDGKLYLAQSMSAAGGPILFAADSGDTSEETNLPALTIVDVSNLPALGVVGQTQTPINPLGWSPNLTPVWVRPGLLVWSGGSGGPIPLAAGAGGVADGAVIGVGGFLPWRGNGGRLFAFDVSSPSTPNFVSEVNLTTNSWWSFSSAYTAAGLVYISHQASEFIEGVTLPGQPPTSPIITVDKDTGQTVTNQSPSGVWVQRYYMDVIDYADPKSPTLRAPVNIPGQLNGLGHAGAILYTVAPHWTNWQTDWKEWLDASAYDGVTAALVDSLALPSDWPHPLLVTDSGLFISRPDVQNSTSQIESWNLADTGKFVRLGTMPLASTANNLAAFGPLLVAQLSSSTLLLDATQPAALVAIGKGAAQSCMWYDLSRSDGSLSQGLWVPLGDYGLSSIPTN